jgi:hypothetical protein
MIEGQNKWGVDVNNWVAAESYTYSYYANGYPTQFIRKDMGIL